MIEFPTTLPSLSRGGLGRGKKIHLSTPTEQRRQLRLQTGELRALATSDSTNRVYDVILLRSGTWKGWGINCPPTALANTDVNIFNGKLSFLNPPKHGDYANHGSPSLDLMLGTICNARYDSTEQAIVGQLALAEGTPNAQWVQNLLDGVIQARDNGEQIPNLGMSSVVWIDIEEETDAVGNYVVRSLLECEQVDLVHNPAAGGEIMRIANSIGPAPWQNQSDTDQIEVNNSTSTEANEMLLQQLINIVLASQIAAGAKNGLIERLCANPDEWTEDKVKSELTQLAARGPDPAPQNPPAQSTGNGQPANLNTPAPTPQPAGAPPAPTPPPGQPGNEQQPVGDNTDYARQLQTQLAVTQSELEAARQVQASFLASSREHMLVTQLSASSLPSVMRQAVRDTLPDAWTPEQLTAAIENQRTMLGALRDDNVISGFGLPHTTSADDQQLTSMDQIELATNALFEGGRPGEGVHSLTGIKELYMLLSGDREMHGVFNRQNVYLNGNINTGTFAGLISRCYHTQVYDKFQEYTKWWEKLVCEEDYNCLKPIEHWTMGDVVGDLPKVNEAQPYKELNFKGNKKEKTEWCKRGGFIGITLETIDCDDMQFVRRIPRQLARTAAETLGNSIVQMLEYGHISPVLDSTQQPIFSDQQPGYNGEIVSNYGDLPLSVDSWEQVSVEMETRMNEQGKCVGMEPECMIVHPSMYMAALRVLASIGCCDNENPFAATPGATIDDVGARFAMARTKVIKSKYLKNRKRWYALTNKEDCCSFTIGYRFGRTPEIFSLPMSNPMDQTYGLMFQEDVLPVKVRWFYALGAVDWHGIYANDPMKGMPATP